MKADDETQTTTETRFRELLAAEGLAQPDAVERRADELVFLWHDQKLAVVVELEEGKAQSVSSRTRR